MGHHASTGQPEYGQLRCLASRQLYTRLSREFPRSTIARSEPCARRGIVQRSRNGLGGGNIIEGGREEAEPGSAESVEIRHADTGEARRPWVLFGLFVAIYLVTLRGHLGSQDEEALYMTSVSLVKQSESALNISWTQPEPGDARGPVRAGYELGQPLLAIPLYL